VVGSFPAVPRINALNAVRRRRDHGANGYLIVSNSSLQSAPIDEPTAMALDRKRRPALMEIAEVVIGVWGRNQRRVPDVALMRAQ